MLSSEPGVCVEAEVQTVGAGASCGGGAVCETGLTYAFDFTSESRVCRPPAEPDAPRESETACPAGTVCLRDESNVWRCIEPALATTGRWRAPWGFGSHVLRLAGGPRLRRARMAAPRRSAVRGDLRYARVPGTCAAGLACMRVNGEQTYARRQPAGGACTARSQCELGLDCDETGHCAAPAC